MERRDAQELQAGHDLDRASRVGTELKCMVCRHSETADQPPPIPADVPPESSILYTSTPRSLRHKTNGCPGCALCWDEGDSSSHSSSHPRLSTGAHWQRLRQSHSSLPRHSHLRVRFPLLRMFPPSLCAKLASSHTPVGTPS